MKRLFLCLSLLVLLTVANGVSLEVVKSVTLPTKDLWKPQSLRKFSASVYCFSAENGKTSKKEKTVLCTFDGGNSFSELSSKSSFCDSGIMAKGKLYCPTKGPIREEKENAVGFISTYFSYDNETNSIVDRLATKEPLMFFGGKKVPNITDVAILSDSVYRTYDRTYFLAANVFNGTVSPLPVLFVSRDQVTWDVRTILNVTTGERYSIGLFGERGLVVSSHYSNTRETITVDMRSHKKEHFFANASSPTTVLTLPLNIVMLHGALENSSEHMVDYYSSADKKKIQELNLQDALKQSDAESSGFVLLVSNYTEEQKEAVVISDSSKDGAFSLHITTLSVDDAKEMKAKEEAIQKEKKRQEELAAAREKAKKEAEERERKKEEERRKKEAERRKQFKAMDSERIKSAKKAQKEDGHLIIVRRVVDGTIDLEKETFLPDI